MTSEPYLGKGCCPPRAASVTYLRLGPSQDLVGIVGLQAEFEQLRALGRSPEGVSGAELIAMARKSNYIPNIVRVEAEYALALREAYAEFCRVR